MRMGLAHGYALEHAKACGLTDPKRKTSPLGVISAAIDIEASDLRGKKHVLYATPVVGAPWSCYREVMIYVAVSRRTTDTGRISCGLNQENRPPDMMARLRGWRWNQAPGTIGN